MACSTVIKKYVEWLRSLLCIVRRYHQSLQQLRNPRCAWNDIEEHLEYILQHYREKKIFSQKVAFIPDGVSSYGHNQQVIVWAYLPNHVIVGKKKYSSVDAAFKTCFAGKKVSCFEVIAAFNLIQSSFLHRYRDLSSLTFLLTSLFVHLGCLFPITEKWHGTR